MVYILDPKECNGTCFLLDEYKIGGYSEYMRANKPIPTSCFPKNLTVNDASQEFLDIFRVAVNIFIASERVRVVMEERDPGHIEFILVKIYASLKLIGRLNLASDYYFINVLGRAQRLLWLEMPLIRFPTRDDGAEIFGAQPDVRNWKLRERANGEPLIWHDSPWLIGNRNYSSHTAVFVEDVLWQELNSKFPNQLNPQRVGGKK